MKRFMTLLGVVAVMVLAAGKASAAITMTMDSGPWYLDSNGNETEWFNQAKADTVNGTFINMRTGTYPGTNNVDPVDFLSAGNPSGAKWLYWFYYIPNETVADITTNNLLQTKLVIDWGGDQYALAPNNTGWVSNDDSAWVAAGAMENYNDGTHTGVIGQIRFSWSLDEFGSTVEEYQEAVMAVQTFAEGDVRYRSSSTDAWQYDNIRANVVPEPTTFVVWGLLGVVAAGYGVWRRRAA